MYIEFNDNHDDDTVVRCIDDYYYEDDGLVYTKSLNGEKYRFYFDDMEHFTINPGFYLDEDDHCVVTKKDSSLYELDDSLAMEHINFTYLGIPLEYFNTLMALSGLFISAIFLYGLVRFI
jgi:hypothetical protein